MNPLSETWQIHNNINLYLLESISDEFLTDSLASKGRNVAEQFAHMHSVRLMWLKVAATAFIENIIKLEKDNLSKTELLLALKESCEAIKTLFEQSTPDGKIKGFKPHTTAFLGYLISHESHHRGQIMLALKQSGHPVDKKIQYGIWEWGVR